VKSLRYWPATVLAAVVLLVLAGCSGVPRTSRPEVIGPIGGNQSAGDVAIAPKPGDDPRSIVSGFLRAGVAADARHSGSRQFLTADAGGKWQDSTVTILDDYQVDLPDVVGDTATVQVTGRPQGQLDAHGIFTPQLGGSGAGDKTTFSFRLKRTAGEWRIDQLQKGVLITEADFQGYYNPRYLYFFDSTSENLVPDLRYSPLSDEPLGDWLLAQLVAGPRPDLAQSVQNEIPDQVDARRVALTMGDPLQVELPGSAQLDDQGKQRLAAQLAQTFAPIQIDSALTLTDSGQTVNIPNSGPVFSTHDFSDNGPESVPPAVQAYFVRDGGLMNGVTDKPLPGAIGSATYRLSSVALRRDPAGGLRVIGVTTGNSLLMGSTLDRLTRIVTPDGLLSRPVWQPHSTDAWVGLGGAIYRIGQNGKPQQVPIPPALGGAAASVVALQFSPDGVRVALLLHGANDTNAVWVGSVVRSGSNVSIENFEPVTPAALAVTDVAWTDSTTLVLIAALANEPAKVWKLQSDGSYLVDQGNAGLPGGLRSIAGAPGQPVLVATEGPAIWVQQGSAWAPLSGRGQTVGSAPTYAP
jgi:hypothetical protein